MFSENIFLKIQPDIDQIITFSMVQQQKKTLIQCLLEISTSNSNLKAKLYLPYVLYIFVII